MIVIGCVCACTENMEEHLNVSRESSKQLAVQLKAKLKASLQSHGPLEAITVCNVEAENIALQVSETNKLQVGRTSLRVRNSNNTADSWEEKKLAEFEQLKNTGSDLKALEVFEVTKESDARWFRYMKAIPTQEVCVVCHGKHIAPPIQEKINSLYPNDQATGFELGDLRGAFTVKIKL